MSAPAVQVGDDVLVPWGVSELKAKVRDLRLVGGRTDAVLDIMLPDAEEPISIVLDAMHLRPAAATGPVEESLVHWLVAFHFQEKVAAAVSAVAPAGSGIVSHFGPAPRADIVLTHADGSEVLVEVKAVTHLDPAVIRSAVRSLDRSLAERAQLTGGIIVFNQDTSPPAAETATPGTPYPIVVWRGPDDNEQLRRAIASALPGPDNPS